MYVHLVDGTFELFRAYYGAPSRLSPKGTEIGATRSMLRNLISLLRRPEVTHVACAFDTVIESFRNKLFEGYKTGEGIDPLLFAQFPIVEEGVRALGIPVWSMKKFEADDALAAGAKKYGASEKVKQVILCSPDKDLTQCVIGKKVICWDRLRDNKLDEKGVIAKFGIGPESIPDYLALVGDSADGIPGVPGWGAKSASAVLAKYRNLEGIPKEEDSWKVKVRGAARLAENFRENWENVKLYRTLATLRRDVPLKETLSQLKWSGPASSINRFCTKLGDPGIVKAATELAVDLIGYPLYKFLMRVITCNVNGMRSALNKGFWPWLMRQKADVVCLQEMRSKKDDLPAHVQNPKSYHSFFFPAQKPGYSGVAIYCKKKPDAIRMGLGLPTLDGEGRYLQADFGSLSVSSIYFPSGSSGETRQKLKYEFLDHFTLGCKSIAKRIVATFYVVTTISLINKSTLKTGAPTKRTLASCQRNARGWIS